MHYFETQFSVNFQRSGTAPNSISAVALPQTLLGELTALPQTP